MVLQILHSACGCVQDDKSSGIQNDKRVAVQDDRRQASSMVTRNVFLSTSRCHSEQSEESGEEEWDNGPRSSPIHILVTSSLLQKSTLSKGAKHIGVLNEAKNPVWQADIMNRGGASDPSLTLRMTKGTVRRTKGTVRRTKGRSRGQRDVRSYPLTSYFVQ